MGEINMQRIKRFVKEHKTGVFVSILAVILIVSTMLTN